MSAELIVFDPTGLGGMSGSTTKILAAVNRFLVETVRPLGDPEPAPTPPIGDFLNRVSHRHMVTYFEANGRYCTMSGLNSGRWENTVIFFSEIAQEVGVILIDPEGIEAIISSPGGEGLLDVTPPEAQRIARIVAAVFVVTLLLVLLYGLFE